MIRRTRTREKSECNRYTLLIVIAAVCFVLGGFTFLQFSPRSPELGGLLLSDERSFHAPLPQVTSKDPYDPAKNPLDVPPGKAKNLPSIRVEGTHEERTTSTKYGGAGE
jgi:hypothetical protein